MGNCELVRSSSVVLLLFCCGCAISGNDIGSCWLMVLSAGRSSITSACEGHSGCVGQLMVDSGNSEPNTEVSVGCEEGGDSGRQITRGGNPLANTSGSAKH